MIKKSSKAKKSTKRNHNQTLIATIVVVGILVICAFAWQSLFGNKQGAQVAQVTGGTGTITLSLTPATAAVAANTPTNLNLVVNTGTSKISAIQAELTYSDSCLTPSVTQGSFLENTLASAKVASGKITFAYAATPDSGGVQGTGTIATIQTGPKTGNCVIAFTANTIAGAIGVETNALGSANDATINLQGGAASGTPTPTPTSTPTPTPAATSTPTPTPTPYNPPATTPTPSPVRPAINQTTPTTSPTQSYAPQTQTAPALQPTKGPYEDVVVDDTPVVTETKVERPRSKNFFINFIQVWVDGIKSLFGIKTTTTS